MSQKQSGEGILLFKVIFELFIAVLVDITVKAHLQALIPLLPYAWMIVFTHSTWKILTSPKAQKTFATAYAYGNRRNLVASYVVILILGGGVFVAAWAALGRVLGNPSTTIEIPEKKDKIPVPPPTELQPAVTTPVEHPTMENHPPAHTLPSAPLVIKTPSAAHISPDPYIDRDDKTVAGWAMKKADDMLAFYANCSKDITQGTKNKNDGKPLTLGHLGPDAMAQPYLYAWSTKDREDVGRLRQSLLIRLGPDSEGENAFKSLTTTFPGASAASQGFFLCNAVNEYIPHLRKMGEKLMVQFRESAGTQLPPLTSLTDGQRFVIKKKLENTEGNGVRLVIVGSDPKSVVLFDQLTDIFNSAGWRIQQTQIGVVGTTGGSFPNTSYITGPNIASPMLKQVFSAFREVGVDLPLVPDALTFGGGSQDTVQVVIVVH